MATKLPRLNITLEKKQLAMLNDIADKDHISLSMVARNLILDALERREDLALSQLAALRERENEKLIPHDDAWE